jgi:hypothetical protein
MFSSNNPSAGPILQSSLEPVILGSYMPVAPVTIPNW